MLRDPCGTTKKPPLSVVDQGNWPAAGLTRQLLENIAQACHRGNFIKF